MAPTQERAPESGRGFQEDRELGRSTIEIGNSIGVTVPAEWRGKIGVEKGDPVDLELDAENGRVVLQF